MKDREARESINELRDDFEEQRLRVRETFRKVGEWMTTLNDNILEFEVELKMLFESMAWKPEKDTGKVVKRKKK